ncbi:19854_t:CDS:2, partial [Racocetra persica]
VKYTEEGEIVMKVSSKAKGYTDAVKKIEILVELYDTGVGISPDFMKDIWKGFLNIDESKTERQDGTGFGLITCKQLVEINGGKIGAESKLGIGSKFWFTWIVETIPITSAPKASNGVTDLSQMLNRINLSLKCIVLINPFRSCWSAISNFFKNNVKIELFDACDHEAEMVRYRRELNNQSSHTIVLANLYEENADAITKVALELREIHGDDLLIILMAFSSASGRNLVKKLTSTIGGQTVGVFKPITPKKLINYCLQNNLKRNIETDKNKSYNVKNFASSNFGKSTTTDYDVKVTSPKYTSPKCRLRTNSHNETRISYVITRETTEQEQIDLLQSKLRTLELSDLPMLKDITMLKDILE